MGDEQAAASFSLERVPLALRACAPLVYVIASIAAIARSGLPAASDRLWLWLLVGLLSFSLLRGSQQVVRVFVEWAPLVAAMLLYDLLRGMSNELLSRAHSEPQIWFGKLVGGGSLPSAWLQHSLWAGAAHLHWYDYVAWLVYTSHFFVTPLLAVVLYLRFPELFRRYARMVLALAVTGVVTYAAFPAVPPWLAAREGLVPPTGRLINAISAHLPYVNVGPLFERGQHYANAVAAIPSLHAAFALLAALFLARCTRRRVVRVLLGLYPLAMGFALVYSGEHFVLDILLGWLYAGVVFAALSLRARAKEAAPAGRRVGSPAPHASAEPQPEPIV